MGFVRHRHCLARLDLEHAKRVTGGGDDRATKYHPYPGRGAGRLSWDHRGVCKDHHLGVLPAVGVGSNQTRTLTRIMAIRAMKNKISGRATPREERSTLSELHTKNK